MKYKEFGEKTRPTFILLHGEGLSWWSLTNIIHHLKTDYHVVTPIIDGHGEDGSTTFISIQDSAEKLIHYIDANLRGSVFAIGGLSLGAQIVIEVLSKRTDIAKYAILESVLIFPVKHKVWFTILANKLFHRLIRKRWFAKLQANSYCIKKDMFEQYYKDCTNISRESQINITLNMSSYTAPNELKNTKAKVLIMFGHKEVRRMDKSVKALMKIIPKSQVCIAPEMSRGELSLVHYKEYLSVINYFMV